MQKPDYDGLWKQLLEIHCAYKDVRPPKIIGEELFLVANRVLRTIRTEEVTDCPYGQADDDHHSRYHECWRTCVTDEALKESFNVRYHCYDFEDFYCYDPEQCDPYH